jgi:hypothetical protein
MYHKHLIESIKSFKKSDKLKKSKIEMDLRELTHKYNTVYYLYNNDVITYIGQSLNVNDFTINRRIIEHHKNGKKFDKYIIRKVELEYSVSIIESVEILKYKPVENKSFSVTNDELRFAYNQIYGPLTKEDERYIYVLGMKRSGNSNLISEIIYNI